MAFYTLNILFHIFVLASLQAYLIDEENEAVYKFMYTLNTKIVHSMSPKDPIFYLFSGYDIEARIGVLRKYIENEKSKPNLQKMSKSVNNLYSTLKHFMNDKCLIVVNNFENIDIQSTIEYPVVLRQLEIAVGSIIYLNPIEEYEVHNIETIWILKETVSKLNSNFSQDWLIDGYYHSFTWECSILKHIYSIQSSMYMHM